MTVGRTAPADGLEPDLRDARYTVGSALVIANAVVYLASEAITAAAWRTPPYSYSRNYISDLGVPDVVESGGRLIDSPLHGLMNTAFLVHGAVFVLAAVLLRPVIRRPRLRRGYLILAIVHGVGNGLVGLFPSSGTDLTAATSALHGLGAVLAIGGGNAAAIVVGVDLFRRRRGLGTTFIAVGALGIGAFLFLLLTMGGSADGIPERISVYTIQAAEILAGVALLVGRRIRT